MQKKIDKKKRVAILFGGQSTEHEISLRSSIGVIQAINKKNYNLVLIGVDKRGRWILCDEDSYLFNIDNPLTIRLAPTKRFLAVVPGCNSTQFVLASSGQALPPIDVVFSVLHGNNGENGSVQGLFQILQIPYVGPSVLGSAICMDKDATKRVLRDSGIMVTSSITLFRNDRNMPIFTTIRSRLGLPLFIKPASQGSSIGVSKVFDQISFDAAIKLAFIYDSKILIEQAVVGREIEVSVLGNNNPEISVCGEIVTNDNFYTYDTKYLQNNSSNIIIPALLSQSIKDKIQRIARKAYLVLSCEIMARIDFFVTDKGLIILNEVNTIPGFTSISMYPKLWEASGVSYSSLIDRLISLAIDRNQYNKKILKN